MELLKFITCGSVDDGKSTLIGHILYDSKLLYTDQEKALELDSKVGSREGKIDYSLLLDGLMAEREQGITIDVAYRYFTTDNRSFIVADTPGHEEYTRNMAVGASFADLAVILIDAKQGVLIQTKRHARICNLMGIRYFVFAVNKMDLVDYKQERFEEIVAQVNELAAELKLENTVIIPVSATEGDNVTKRSENLSWYDGPVLLEYLENVDIKGNRKETGFYMPVQRVCRPNHTFRGFQGQVEAGVVKTGDELTVLPGGEKAHVKSLHIMDQEVSEIEIGRPATIQLDREVDVSRGSVLTSGSDLTVSNRFTATLLWMDDVRLINGRNFYVKLGTKMIPGTVTEIVHAIDVNTGEENRVTELNKNGIAVCNITLADGIVLDLFKSHKTMGELILIDRVTNMTSACGVVTEILSNDDSTSGTKLDREARSNAKNQRAVTIAFPRGYNGIDEDFIRRVERELFNAGRHTYTYLPKPGMDPVHVIRHLNRAGIVVLYMPADNTYTGAFAEDRTYKSNWIDRFTGSVTVSDVVEYVLRVTSASNSDAE